MAESGAIEGYLSNNSNHFNEHTILIVGNSPLQHARKWTAIGCGVVCLHSLVSFLAPRGAGLTAFGDLTQCFLLLGATIGVLSNVRHGNTKSRLFWGLMGLGCAMWFGSQVLWTYFEVFLRQEAPNPFVGDVVLFLHIVPMMAAVAVLPHFQEDDRAVRMGSLDLLMLFTWWLYLYLFIVIPWQYVYPVEAEYGRSFDVLYLAEHLVLFAGLILVWRRSAGAWRGLYPQLFGAALLYCTGSYLASRAIDAHVYYTGSLFDVPLVAAMAWFAAIGFVARSASEEGSLRGVPGQGHGIWKTRLAMAAVFFTPLMVAWAQFGGNAPQRVRTYRLLLTVAVMVLMGGLVFLKQHLLDQELLSLLRLSRQNLDEMCILKDELESKEHSLRWHGLELQRKNLELQQISFTDPLTGVWNRRYLEEILTAEAGQVLRNYERARGNEVKKMDHRDLVFLMVDVDFFKRVNDLHGHPAGDRLLQLVAERLGRVVRKSDVLVRWGGEEFLIMSRSADPAGTPAFCDRVLEVMASEEFDLGHGVRVRKTCSVGWASFPWSRHAYEAICAEEAIELADTALYRAKAAGRNQGIGILPAEGSQAAPHQITLQVLQNDTGVLTQDVRVQNVGCAIRTEAPAEEMTPDMTPAKPTGF